MFQALIYNKEEKLKKIETEHEIEDALKKAGNLLWVDITDPSESDIDLLVDQFNLHQLAIEDAIFPQNYPKFEDYEDYLFIVMHEMTYPNRQENSITAKELNIFLGKNFVLTIHDQPLTSISKVFQRCRTKPLPMQQGPGGLLHAIVDTLVDDYFPVMDQLEDKIEKLEERALENPDKSVLESIVDLKKSILLLRNFILPQRKIMGLLGRPGISFIRRSTAAYFRDVYDHVVRVGDLLDNYRDVLNSAMDAYLSVISNRTNEIMKTLTIITTILMPMSVITSFYGMNVKIPEFDWGIKGYVWVLGLLVLAVAGILIFLKRKRMI